MCEEQQPVTAAPSLAHNGFGGGLIFVYCSVSKKTAPNRIRTGRIEADEFGEPRKGNMSRKLALRALGGKALPFLRLGAGVAGKAA